MARRFEKIGPGYVADRRAVGGRVHRASAGVGSRMCDRNCLVRQGVSADYHGNELREVSRSERLSLGEQASVCRESTFGPITLGVGRGDLCPQPGPSLLQESLNRKRTTWGPHLPRVTCGNDVSASARYACPVRKVCAPSWGNAISCVRKICVDNPVRGRNPVRCLWITSAEYAWISRRIHRPPFMRGVLVFRGAYLADAAATIDGLASAERFGASDFHDQRSAYLADAGYPPSARYARWGRRCPRDMRECGGSVREICAATVLPSARYAHRTTERPQGMRAGAMSARYARVDRVRRLCAGCPRGMRPNAHSRRSRSHGATMSARYARRRSAYRLREGACPRDMRARMQAMSARYASIRRSRGVLTVPARRALVGVVSSGLDIALPAIASWAQV